MDQTVRCEVLMDATKRTTGRVRHGKGWGEQRDMAEGAALERCPVCGAPGWIEARWAVEGPVTRLMNATCTACGWHYTATHAERAKR